MARLGNYVGVPGGGTNAFKGLSDSLSNLSKMYTDRDTLAREEALKKETLAENQRRWDITEARAGRAEQERLDGIKDAENARKFVWDAANPQNQKYRLEDYSPENQRYFTALLDNVKGQETAARDFLAGKSDVDSAASLYQKNLNASKKLTPQAKADKVAQYRADLIALRNDLTRGPEAGYDIESRIGAVTNKHFAPMLKEIDDTITRGDGLVRSEKSKALLSRVPEHLRGKIDRSLLDKAVTGSLTGPTKADLVALEQARVDTINETADKNIKYLNDYYTQVTKGTNSKSSSKGGSGTTSYSKRVATALDTVGKYNIKNADRGITALLKETVTPGGTENISPEVAAAVVGKHVDEGMFFDFMDSFPKKGSTEFATLVQEARELQNIANSQGSVGKNGRPFIDRDAYTYKPVAAKPFEQLQRERIKFAPNNKRIFDGTALLPSSAGQPSAAPIGTGTPAQAEAQTKAQAEVVAQAKAQAELEAKAIVDAAAKAQRQQQLDKEALTRRTVNAGGSNTMPRQIDNKRVTEQEYANAVDDVGDTLIKKPLSFMNRGLNSIANAILEPGREVAAIAQRLPGVIPSIKEYSKNAYPSVDEIMGRTPATRDVALPAAITAQAKPARIPVNRNADTMVSNAGEYIQGNKAVGNADYSDFDTKDTAEVEKLVNMVKAMNPAEKYPAIINQIVGTNYALAQAVAKQLGITL